MLGEADYSYGRPLVIWPLTPAPINWKIWFTVFQAWFVRFWLGTEFKCEVGYRETLFSNIWFCWCWMSQSYGSQPPSFCWLLLVIKERKGRSRGKSGSVGSLSRWFGLRGRWWNLLVVDDFWLGQGFHISRFFPTHFRRLEEKRLSVTHPGPWIPDFQIVMDQEN